jgi:hypothetical protein
MRRIVVLIIAVLTVAAAADAQVLNPRAIRFNSPDHTSALNAPTSYVVDFYAEGATSPVQSPSIAASAVAVVPGTTPVDDGQDSPAQCRRIGGRLARVCPFRQAGTVCTNLPAETGPVTPKVFVSDTWPKTVRLGELLRIDFEVREGIDDHVHDLYVDLEGDGVDGWRYHGLHLATIRQVQVMPKRIGTFKLVISATSEAGCSDRTGVARLVIVKGS